MQTFKKHKMVHGTEKIESHCTRVTEAIAKRQEKNQLRNKNIILTVVKLFGKNHGVLFFIPF